MTASTAVESTSTEVSCAAVACGAWAFTGPLRRGNHAATTMSPRIATIRDPIAVACMACTNASFAAVVSALPAGPSFAATPYVPETDSAATDRAAAGRPATLGVMSSRYTAASNEPSTATPRAPPTCRIVLLTADPTPAFSRGSVDMIDSVDGGITLAMPTPWMKKTAHSIQIGVATWMNMNAPSEKATSAIPIVQTTFGPYRLTYAALRGAKISWAAANGTNSSPASSGEYPRTTCR